MTTLRTRVFGWPFTMTGYRETAWVSHFEGAPMTNVTVGYVWEKHLQWGVSDARRYTEGLMLLAPIHMAGHPVDDEEDCDTCAYYARLGVVGKGPDSNPQPLPQVHSPKDGVKHAIWYRGERVTSIARYWYSAGERYCEVNTITVTGALTRRHAPVAEITVSAYRTIV